APGVTSSAQARDRIAQARERQLARLDGTGATCNGHMDTALVRRLVRLDSDAERLLHATYERGALSARGRERVLRVAMTIADLDARDTVGKQELLRAIGLRQDATTAPEEAASPSPAPRVTRACGAPGSPRDCPAGS